MTSPLLELDHVTKRFGRVVIAEDLSFAVGPGDTVGIVGPNGAGKTSLFGLISGDLSPGAGEISFAGRPVTKLNAAARCRLGIGRTYQVPRPFTDMTVFENVLGVNAEGIAVIWIEHVVRALTAVVSRLICLAGGKFVGDGEPAAVLANPAVREVFLGSEVTASLSGGTLTAEVGDPGEG